MIQLSNFKTFFYIYKKILLLKSLELFNIPVLVNLIKHSSIVIQYKLNSKFFEIHKFDSIVSF